VHSPEIAKRFAELGADPQFGTPSAFAAYVAADLAKWTSLAKSAGLKIE
jgi:tripartite-type tricarboxylate transporter receptor subunit TctC